jgi:pimeloyl-ACP methyl ester carboxylesterase
MKLQCQFVQVGERRVFVRAAGPERPAPALVLLHQSPQSSAALGPLIDALAWRYAVFAPDTPGFGHSDPLPLAQPTIPDLAAALSALLAVLGLHRVLLYGVHTGANIGARLALDHPHQVAALVGDGLALFDAKERQPLLDGYLPPFEPLWDGTHLVWLWQRLREQMLFFPWHHGSAASRLAYAPPTVEALHANTLDLLAAGDGYRAGYRAPLLYEDGAHAAAQLTVPAVLLYRDSDVLRPHLARLPALPPGVAARAVADAAALQVAAEAFWGEHAGSASLADVVGVLQRSASPRRRVVETPAGALAFHQQGHGADVGDALLQLGEIGEPAALPADRPASRACWAMDWPGHGASHGWPAELLTLPTLADAVAAALDTLAAERGTTRFALRARGGAGTLAVELAAKLGPRVASLTLIDPLPLDAAERDTFLAALPDLAPHATGAHLLAAWNWVRLKALFWPWLPPSAAAAIRAAAPPPRQVHEQVVEMLRAGERFAALWRALLVADLPQRLASLTALGVPCAVQAGAHPERQRLAARLASPPSPTTPGAHE